MFTRTTWAVTAPLAVGGLLILAAPAPAQVPPVPRPVTTPAPATPQTTPAAPARSLDPEAAGVPIYPGAELLESLDAGHNQRFYLYGTNTPFAEIVQYYKTALKNSGRELFKAPAMQQFDLGRFQEDAMTYPPSVVVKDYAWMDSPGYLHVSGTTEKRYKTIIQIVPPFGGR